MRALAGVDSFHHWVPLGIVTNMSLRGCEAAVAIRSPTIFARYRFPGKGSLV